MSVNTILKPAANYESILMNSFSGYDSLSKILSRYLNRNLHKNFLINLLFRNFQKYIVDGINIDIRNCSSYCSSPLNSSLLPVWGGKNFEIQLIIILLTFFIRSKALILKLYSLFRASRFISALSSCRISSFPTPSSPAQLISIIWNSTIS